MTEEGRTTLLEFPCEFPIKIMGARVDDFAQTVLEVVLRHAPDLQHFLGERNFAEGCLYGECSLLASLGPMIPHRTKAYFAAGVRGDVDRLFRLHHDLLRFQQDIIEPLVAESRIDGAYDKALVKMGGFDAMPLRLLSPYQGLSDAHYEYVHSLFRDLYPDWS